MVKAQNTQPNTAKSDRAADRPNPKPLKVTTSDVHKQAKEMSAAHTCGIRGVTKRASK